MDDVTFWFVIINLYIDVKIFINLFCFLYAIENASICHRTRRFSTKLSKVKVFENGGAASYIVDGRKRRFLKNPQVTADFKQTKTKTPNRQVWTQNSLCFHETHYRALYSLESSSKTVPLIYTLGIAL